jgi:hypothetical protein
MKASRPAPLVAARVDRSNFRVLTSDRPAERATTQSVHGAMLAPARATARPEIRLALFQPTVEVATVFSAAPNGDLSATRFTGPAVRAVASLDAYGAFSTGSTVRPSP